MKELKEAREKMGSLKKQCEDIAAQALKEKRSYTADEDQQIDKMTTELIGLEKVVRSFETVSQIAVEQRDPEKPEVRKANSELRSFLMKGPSAFTKEERNKLFDEEGGQPVFKVEKRASTDPQTVTTTAGGYLIQTDLNDTLVKALKMYGGVRDAATIFETSGGNPMDQATIDDTSNKGRLLAINTQVTVNHLVFDKTTFYAYKFSSDEILVPTELIQDEKVDLNAYVGELLGERVGRIESDYMTTGSGSSQPQGCAYAASDAGLALTSASAITKANLIDLAYSVDPAYRKSPKCGYMFNDKTAKVLYKLSLGTATDLPLFFSGSLAGTQGNAAAMASTLFGFPYWINQSMVDIAAAVKPVIFGDFSRFKIRDVAGFRLLRLTERYADYDQIALILLHRADSRLVTSGAIKALTMGNT